MTASILILGGGVGGTIVANRLARALRPGEANVTLIDSQDSHVYQPGWLYLPLNREKPEALTRPISSLLDRRVQFINGTAGAIDLMRRTVQVNGTLFVFDFLVLATGARLDPGRVPGIESAYHFYDAENALRLRNALEIADRGRIVIGPSRKLYKCPPAPLEFTLLLDDYLRRRRVRDRFELVYVYPFSEVFHFKAIAKIISPLLERRGIQAVTNFNVKEFRGHKIFSHEGGSVSFDLAIIVPPHRVSTAIEESGLAPGGWVSVDPANLRVKGEENIYALGDVTDLAIPKTGAVAHGQARFVVQGILGQLRGQGDAGSYEGRGMCLIETGGGRATTMRFNYQRTSRPPQPSPVFHWAKALLNRFYWQLIPPGRF